MKSIAHRLGATKESGLNGMFWLRFPLGVRVVFAGGPFKAAKAVPGAYRVKCATEQPGGADAVVPCEDFGVPTEAAMLVAVESAIEVAFDGQVVFAGCMGGIGRTGTFLSVCLKVLQPDLRPDMIVSRIREIYLRGAVETPAQRKLIETIDVRRLQKRVKWLWLKAVLRNKLGWKR